MTPEDLAKLIADLLNGHREGIQACAVLEFQTNVVGVTMNDDRIFFVTVEADDSE